MAPVTSVEPYQREDAQQQVDAGGHHGGCVDLSRDRRRSGHGIRQPDHERRLGRLARPRAGGADPGGEHPQGRVSHLVYSGDGKGVKESEHPDNCDAEADIADAGDDKGLAAGGGILRIPVPEADQGIGAKTDPFPAQVSSGVRSFEFMEDSILLRNTSGVLSKVCSLEKL